MPKLLDAVTHARLIADASIAAYYLDGRDRVASEIHVEAMRRQFGKLADALGYRVIPLTADEAESEAA